MKRIAFALIAAAALAQGLDPAAAHASCTALSSDLARGSANPSGQVLALQNFLSSTSYLAVAPNGVFGPATLAAVKAFQSANGISATGTVGPITRLAIQIRSCSSAPDQANSQSTQAQTPAANVGQGALITALSPAAGESLALGSTATIRWTGPAGTIYNVILEDASSTRMGFLVSGTRATSYDWTVGDLYSNGSTVKAPPGVYRVRAEDAGQGPQSSDRLSGAFTVAAPPLTIANILPQSGRAAPNASVVLYGSGFTQSTLIDFYGYGQIAPLFVSPDGRALVFTVPSGSYTGPHTFTAVNSYDSSSYTTRSAEAQITVIR
ncbi:MAG TPA: peptidoglycan-binding domain-containing protein [Candidatus Paceibacterota bacterium]|nr:peptidoglycan-binding domain-containing protein [Candidatus Paceibacterota bacterium]